MKSRVEKSLKSNKPLLEKAIKELIGCKYFETITSDDLRYVLRQSTYLEVPTGTFLIREGELDDDMYFLLTGSLAVTSGKQVILRLNAPGDIVGEFAVVSSAPRSADVITEEPSRLVRVSATVVKGAEAKPELTSRFYTLFTHIMAAKLTETSRRARLYEQAVLEAQEMATSHEKLEEDIQEKLQEITLYSKVIERGNDAVLVTDSEGNIQQFNPAALKMFAPLKGRKKKSAIKIQNLLKGFDLGDYNFQQASISWRGEWIREQTDDLMVLQSTVTPIMSSNNTPIGIAYQLLDMTIQKEQERDIARKNEEIQKALVDLEATYDELKKSDRMKSETLSVISDEMTTPVVKISTFSEQLIQDLGADVDHSVFSNIISIQEQSDYLRSITGNINHLIELQQNFQLGTMDHLEIRDILAQMQNDLKPLAERKRIGLRLEIPDTPLTLTGDEKQFQMVFNLLVEQAVMIATPNSEILIEAELIKSASKIQLIIHYDGPSLSTLSPQAAGEGRFGLLVGLPLARKVISRYQGSLQFQGDSKKAQAVVLLPLAQKEGLERPNRIFIVDEQEMDRLIVQGVIEHLWPDSILFSTSNPYEFLDNYEDFKPDLAIIDPHFKETGWSNHRLIGTLTQNRRHACPLLTVSALYKNFAERDMAVERGVTDFLEKPYSIFDLRFKIKSLLQSHRKEETLHLSRDQAQKQAFTDGLTRLANRKHFDNFMDSQIKYSQETGKPCSLILMDIDNFKHYNDSHGHQRGDEVLQEMGRILTSNSRASDLAARYGGEEFTLVLPETGKEMAVAVAEKVRRAIQESKVYKAEQQPLGYLSASMGVATFSEDAKSVETLIKIADNRLYEAKDEGRNRVVSAEQKAGGKKAAKKAKAG